MPFCLLDGWMGCLSYFIGSLRAPSVLTIPSVLTKKLIFANFEGASEVVDGRYCQGRQYRILVN